MKKTTWESKVRLLALALIAAYGATLLYLYYNQACWVSGSAFESDLPAHIKMAVVDGWYYSLTAFVYKLCYLLPSESAAAFCVALVLTLLSLWAVYLTAKLLQYLLQGNTEGEPKVICIWGGLLLNLVMPIYVKGVADGRYIGMQSASVWHNSTYIAMKPLALLCILLYLPLLQKTKEKKEAVYETELSIKTWWKPTLALTLCTMVKPSFLVAFAPALALVLLWDWTHGTKFVSVFKMGCTVLPSLAVVLFQNAVLFGSGGSSMEFKPGYAVSLHSGHPLVSATLSILFPVLVLLLHFRKELGDRTNRFFWLCAAFGFGELFLLAESGNRALDGNFQWGYGFMILLLFATSFVLWIEDVRKAMTETGIKAKILPAVTGLFLALHLYCGGLFYVRLLQGVSYFMWN